MSYVIVDSNSNIIYGCGDYKKNICAHSTLKPFQSLPVILMGLNKKYQLLESEIAVLSSSHIAQHEHIVALESILKKTNISEQDMILSESAPLGRIAFDNWKKLKLPKRKIYHPCSGKHIGLMLAQRELTGSIYGYDKADNELQKLICRIISEFCEYPTSKIKFTTDGCGVPTYILPMYSIACGYKNIIYGSTKISETYRQTMAHNINAIEKNPLLLEGDDCVSTILSNCNNIIAKTGINGLLAIGVKEKNYGIFIKSDLRCWNNIPTIIKEIFNKIGLKNDELIGNLNDIIYKY